MSRECGDWLETYLTYTQNTEPPTSYHTFCGLSVIAGALQRKVYIKWGLGQVIYPNLYIILVGPSGRTRKGVALGIAKDLLRQIPGVSVAPESSSGREALIIAMKRALVNFQDDDGAIRFHCSLTAFSEELSVFLGQGDIKFLANLTDWYDSKDEWEYETIGRGKDSLQGLCFNLAGGTAPDWIQSMLPYEAVGGGFTARVIFVVEERKGKTVPEHDITEEETELGQALLRDLERVTQLSGPFTFTPEGKQSYVDWYTKEDALMQQGEMPIADSRFSSYCERRATHLRKLMMLTSVSRGDSLEITGQDFKRALSIMKLAERNMHKTFGGLGKSKFSEGTEKVIDYIKSVNITTRSVLLTKFYRDIDAQSLRTIEESLEQMGSIKIKLVPDRGDKVYTWVGPK